MVQAGELTDTGREREERATKVSPQSLNMICDKVDQITARKSDLSVYEWMRNSNESVTTAEQTKRKTSHLCPRRSSNRRSPSNSG